jgi:adenosylhomocysteinase
LGESRREVRFSRTRAVSKPAIIFVDKYTLPGGVRINLIGESRFINLAAAEGHPAIVMDMSFADQAPSALHPTKAGKTLENRAHPVPKEIARLKLASTRFAIDEPSTAQRKYLAAWNEGT